MLVEIEGCDKGKIRALRKFIPRIRGLTGILPEEDREILADIQAIEEVSATGVQEEKVYSGVRILPAASFVARHKARICVTGGSLGKDLRYLYVPRGPGEMGICGITFHCA